MGRRPGRSLATLLAAGAVSNLGDGVTLAAAPLLAASVTRDPRAIGAVGVAWSLPWLLFALVSGAVVDRSDRRRLMVGADLVRVVGLAGLTAAVVGGRASIPALVALFFVNAAAETVFDTAWQSTLPMVVDRDDLPRANGWLQTIEFAGNGLLGPALGGVLFAAAAAAPFAVDAASFGISALLLATIPGRFRAAALAAIPDGPGPARVRPCGPTSPRGSAGCSATGCCAPSAGCWPSRTSSRWPASPCWCCWPRTSSAWTPAATACCWPAWPSGACSAGRWPPGCTAASATRAAWSGRSCS